MHKRYFIVTTVDDRIYSLEGYCAGISTYLLDCYGYEETEEEHRFLHAFHTDAIACDDVQSVIELSLNEAMRVRMPEGI